jgi:hypothetical protein
MHISDSKRSFVFLSFRLCYSLMDRGNRHDRETHTNDRIFLQFRDQSLRAIRVGFQPLPTQEQDDAGSDADAVAGDGHGDIGSPVSLGAAVDALLIHRSFTS